MENIKSWVMDETAKFAVEERHWKHDVGRKEASDSEMLKSYSTGLLAVGLQRYDITTWWSFFLFYMC